MIIIGLLLLVILLFMVFHEDEKARIERQTRAEIAESKKMADRVIRQMNIKAGKPWLNLVRKDPDA